MASDFGYPKSMLAETVPPAFAALIVTAYHAPSGVFSVIHFAKNTTKHFQFR
ncbi:MAG: hypothetical protein LUE11_10480 [Clostridia bacterium]|nr:hypothetical protein [Clostridia bacterium]